MPWLPSDVEEQILYRLPPKSLLRFRSVCKSWRSLIDNPSFISVHRRHSRSFLLLHFHKQLEHPFNPLLLCSLSHYGTLSKYSLPLPSYSIHAISHCHGLLCLSHNEKCSSFTICNPSLRRTLSLPKPRCYCDDEHVANFAFGFDSGNHDYKIVRLVSKKYSLAAPAVEVYSLASGTWRILPPYAAPVCSIDGASATTWNAPYGFVNGLVHWGASRRSGQQGVTWYSFILSFDFVDEVFREVALPPRLSHIVAMVSVVGGSDEKPLTVCHYCANLSNGRSPCSATIWVMKKYGEVKSWNKLFSLDITGSHLDVPFFSMKIRGLEGSPPMALCVMNNREVLVPTEEEDGKRGLDLLDVKKRKFADLLQHGGLGQRWRHIHGYREKVFAIIGVKVYAAGGSCGFSHNQELVVV